MMRPCLSIPLLLAALCLAANDSPAETPMLELRGRTMGTQYLVKVFDPPSDAADLQLFVDAEVRRVNDQMSTYLKSSELSKFNASESTEWFDVSRETATVVAFAQQVAELTEGAFDVTVGPLVDAWSFGAAERTNQIPDDERLAELARSVGYRNLETRIEPPALRKKIPGLHVDLSALAKGHGVDRVVEMLGRRGIENVFVEIGGEVRTAGDKGGVPWRVGIQLPDAPTDQVMVAHAMGGDRQSMATSGDYRNYFEVDGKRFSHTIDPRTGRPVNHSLASVSVVAKQCMAADAWATALSVLGPEEGLAIARREGIDAFMVTRTDSGMTTAGTGVLAAYANQETGSSADKIGPAAVGDESGRMTGQPNGANSMGVVLALTLGAFAVILTGMAVGVIFGRRAISGSCGGLANSKNDDGSVSCALCSNPSNACKELRERMGQGAEAADAAAGN